MQYVSAMNTTKTIRIAGLGRITGSTLTLTREATRLRGAGKRPTLGQDTIDAHTRRQDRLIAAAVEDHDTGPLTIETHDGITLEAYDPRA